MDAQQATVSAVELRARSSWEPPPHQGQLTSGFLPALADEGNDFAAARWAASRSCAEALDTHVEAVLDRLNQRGFAEAVDFLRSSTAQLQRAWHDASGQTPPYTELPAAIVHAGSNSADHALALRQLLRHLRGHCSAHVATLRSKECGTLAAAVKSLVRQMLEGTRSHAAPGCAYDLPVLAGWHHDLCARREAKAAPKAAAGGARGDGAAAVAAEKAAGGGGGGSGGGGDDEPLLVVLEDCEHFAPTVLDELVRTCAAARSADGRAALPLAFVFALASHADAISRRVKRGTLVLLRAKRIALSGTQRAVDRLMSRLLCDRSLPRLSADGVDELLAALESDHCSMHAFVQQFKFCLLRHFRTQPLAFLLPLLGRLRPSVDELPRADASAVAALAAALGPAQIRALRALPSVAAALPRPAAAAALRDALPGWLCALSAARAAQVGMTRCVLALLVAAFPGANHHLTAPRRVYADVARAPLHRARASPLALDKLRAGALTADQLAFLLDRWEAILAETARLAPALVPSIAALRGLRGAATAATAAAAATTAAAAAAATAAAAAADPDGGSPAAEDVAAGAAKRRRLQLGRAVPGAAGGTAAAPAAAAAAAPATAATGGGGGLARAAAAWLDDAVRSLGAAAEGLPLHELWQSGGGEADEVRRAFGIAPQASLHRALQKVLKEAGAPRAAADGASGGDDDEGADDDEAAEVAAAAAAAAEDEAAEAAAGGGRPAAEAVRRARAGDLLWAKHVGFPWWPAVVSDASNAEAADAPSLVVTFCHTKDELEMPLLDLKFR